MTNKTPDPDWDPRSDAVQACQIAAFDEMRQRCPIAYSDYMHWSLFKHQDILDVVHNHRTFSNSVSSHLSVPNGMDQPAHTEYRRVIEPYFSAQRMAEFEPCCHDIVNRLVGNLPVRGEIEWMSEFAENFALQAQCAFLGWPDGLHEPLRRWIKKNQQATLAQDRAAMAAIALEFDAYIKELLSERRGAGVKAPDDITTSLLQDRAWGRPLTDAEIISILRNWTVGELATISACVGILAHYLAEHPSLQQQLRDNASLIPAAIDEVLRIHPPLIANRRITTRPVEIAGRKLDAGERISILWASANRDEAVFGDPDEFRLDRDASQNLLYGAGIHVCPGAPLARLELRILINELLQQTGQIALAKDQEPVKARYPASGFCTLPLLVERNC